MMISLTLPHKLQSELARDHECVVSAISDEPGRLIRKWTITWSTAWRVGAVFSPLGSRGSGSVCGVKPAGCKWQGRDGTDITSLNCLNKAAAAWMAEDGWPMKRIKVIQQRNELSWRHIVSGNTFFYSRELEGKWTHSMLLKRKTVKIRMNYEADCLQREKEKIRHTHTHTVSELIEVAGFLRYKKRGHTVQQGLSVSVLARRTFN